MVVWCRGKNWNTNEYNKRLSKENKIDEEIDKKIDELEEERKKRTDEVWKE